MKNNANYSSFKSTILFIELRKKLLSKNMKVEDLFTKQIFLRNPKEIDRRQFGKILFLSTHAFSTLEASDIFNELKYGDTIPINTFIYAYYETDQRYPVAQKNIITDKNKEMANERGEAQKQMLKKCLLKLQKYLQEFNGLNLFREVDQQDLQYITKRQFNQLLILTDIPEFTSKDVRNLVINSLYGHYKDGKITRQNFIKLFKLKQNISPIKTQPYVPFPLSPFKKVPQEKQKSFEQFKKKEGFSKQKQKMPPSPIGYRPKIFGNQPQKKNDIPSKNISVPIIRIKESNDYPEVIPKYKIQKPFQKPANIFKKNQIIPEYVPIVQPNKNKNQFTQKSFQNDKFKKKQPFQYNNLKIPESNNNIKIPENSPKKQQSNSIDDIVNIRQMFPSSFHFYRLGTPSTDELSHFQLLEGFIQRNYKYVDKNNPTTHIGTYKSSDDIFNGVRYQIFMMAGSVLQREKSRIGVARQIQPKDIMQGQLGDCYLLSSIASIISFYPEVIWEKIIFSVNPAHYYVVKLFIDGEWQMIETDDSFPCQYGKPVFAKPHGKQIWVMLLEKCWAKVFKSYRAIQQGTPTQGFRAFTGAPSQYISIQKEEDKKKVLQKLEQTFKKKHVATISGSKYLSSLSKDQQQRLGLISDHAYSFLKILKINGEVVIKMRNPWGKTVWKGDWSFESKKWTKDLRNKYNYNNFYEDGSFYICWNDLIQYFSSFVFCQINPTFFHSSLKLEPKSDKSSYLKVFISEQGTYNFSIYQESKRKHKAIGSKNYDYIPVRMVVLKENNGKYQYINSVNKQNSHCTSFEDEFSRGVYIIAIKLQWKNKIYPIVFNSYGVQKTQIEEISNLIVPQFKKSMIQSYSKRFGGKKKQYTNINIPQAYNQTQFSIERGIGYLKMCNPSTKEFTSKFSMPKCEGLKIIKPNTLPYQFVMKPYSEYIIGFWVSSKGYSYESAQSLSYKSYS